MQRNFWAALICGSLLAGLSLSAMAAPSAPTLATILQEERAWAGLQTRRLQVGEVNWAYSEGGNPAAPTVLLVHGLAGSRDNWNRVARALTPYYHVIIPDLPFHGDTQNPETFDPQLPNLTEQLRRFVEAGRWQKQLHVAGHSLGGGIAALYAALYFQDTQSLLLVDSAGVYAQTQSPYLKDMTKLRELVVAKPGDLQRVLSLAMQQPPFLPQFLRDAQESAMIQQAPRTRKVIERMIELGRFYTPDSFGTVLRTIEAPTQIIWGQQDKLIDAGVLPELTQHLKNEQPPVVLPQVGHTPILEADQLVAARYLAFLRQSQAWTNPFTPKTP